MKVKKSDDEWRKTLSKECYEVCRGKGTEKPFENEYWNFKEKGTYHCRACNQALFSSQHKYDSGSGWPSFKKPINSKCILEKEDLSHGIKRVEALCSSCESHLGHIFDDGPPPLNLRYCINSLALKFIGS